MKQVITDNGNFVRSVEIIECVIPKNYFQVKFTSKWRDAKDPDAEQVNFTAMLSREELGQFSDLLKQAAQ